MLLLTLSYSIVSTYRLCLSTAKDDRHEKEERETKHYMYTVALNNRITSNAQEGGMKNRAMG